MQWTVRLETRTAAGEVKTTELVTFSRPAMVSTLADVGLMLAETGVTTQNGFLASFGDHVAVATWDR